MLLSFRLVRKSPSATGHVVINLSDAYVGQHVAGPLSLSLSLSYYTSRNYKSFLKKV